MYRAQYAILLDGGFVTKKLRSMHKRAVIADDVVALCDRLKLLPEVKDYDLLRIYYYDAPPSAESTQYPVSRRPYQLAKTTRYREAQRLFDSLIMKPGFALRMGETHLAHNRWRISNKAAESLIKTPRPLQDEDFNLDISQKGVDMRIGMDMARLAIREMVRAVVVVTSDSDFIPAFKFVRREGVKVILDVLGHKGVRVELKQHADFVVA